MPVEIDLGSFSGVSNEQLNALDETEPNYYRCRLPENEFAVSLPSGEPITGCHVYAGSPAPAAQSSRRPESVKSGRCRQDDQRARKVSGNMDTRSRA